jgi:Arm DNA-binding domain
MAHGIHRLKARHIERLGPGKHSDGGNLYLLVKKGGTKSWIFIYTAANGGRREIGLGPLNGVSIEVAREQVGALREALYQGLDPQAERDRLRVAATPPVTFKAAPEDNIASHKAGYATGASTASHDDGYSLSFEMMSPNNCQASPLKRASRRDWMG